MGSDHYWKRTFKIRILKIALQSKSGEFEYLQIEISTDKERKVFASLLYPLFWGKGKILLLHPSSLTLTFLNIFRQTKSMAISNMSVTAFSQIEEGNKSYLLGYLLFQICDLALAFSFDTSDSCTFLVSNADKQVASPGRQWDVKGN